MLNMVSVSLWTIQQRGLGGICTKLCSQRNVAFTDRYGIGLGVHEMRTPATDVEALEMAKGILLLLLHCISEALRLGSQQDWVMGSRCALLERVKLRHLHILGLAWPGLWLMWEECRLIVRYMLHSQIVCVWRWCYIPSSNFEPFYFLLQRFIQSCVFGTDQKATPLSIIVMNNVQDSIIRMSTDYHTIFETVLSFSVLILWYHTKLLHTYISVW